MYVCSAIKSAPSWELARYTPCQFRDWGAMFLEGYYSPSCFVAKERDILVNSPQADTPFLTFSTSPFHYWSLADLIRAMPVKRVGVHELRGVPFI